MFLTVEFSRDNIYPSIDSCYSVVFVSLSQDESYSVEELKYIHPKFALVFPCEFALFSSPYYFSSP